MSAIWGQISFDKSIGEKVIELMSEPYRRKCKLDKIQEYKQDTFYFGCGLQYVTEEAQREILPIFDEERQICFTADCILDNRQELVDELHIADKDIPDGTLMYYAYLKWGMDCLNHFRGLFSLAIYDKKRKNVYLATDQVASRCLYYYVKDKTVTFSTLIEPIRKVNKGIDFNELYLKDYATAPGIMPSIVSAETPYEELYKLNPGSWIEISEERVEEHIYWDLRKTKSSVRFRKAEEYGSYFCKIYGECVADALRTNRNVGIAMSSGLDSASVGALAADLLIKESKTLYAYTYVPYEKDIKTSRRHYVMDEREDVRRIAAMHPNIETHFLNNHGKNCYEELDTYIDIMEIPYKAYVNIPNLYEIFEQAEQAGCRIVLTGQMGNGGVSFGNIDDVLYELYKNKKYITFLRNLNCYSKTVKESRKAALRGCIRYFNYTGMIYKKKELGYMPDNPFLNSEAIQNYPLEERYQLGEISYIARIPMSNQARKDFLCKRAPYTYMGEYETKLGLAAGVVVRDPTKDIRMLEYCYHLPYELFAHGGMPRWLIRENLKEILPKNILNNWMRYGVQNSDWQLRILRDWTKICEVIAKDAVREEAKKYINNEIASQFISEIKTLSDKEIDAKLCYLLYLCVLSRFIHRC